MTDYPQDAATQQQEEQQGLAEEFARWAADPVAQREYVAWQLRNLHAEWIAEFDAHSAPSLTTHHSR